MTTHFHAAAEELEAHGDAPLLALADARVFHRSFCDQSAELYGADGHAARDVDADRLFPGLGLAPAEPVHRGFVPSRRRCA